MRVSKWGNSLAIRLSAEMVKKLGVIEGDEIVGQVHSTDESITIRRKRTLEELWERVDQIRETIEWPEDYKFDREEANSRD
jgi:antitoxin MazE